MSEDPTSLARDANRQHQSLKELLNTNDPYGKEVEFQRKKLRRQYLQLLLVHPHAPESKDAETHLWMQTSYAFITAYKRKVHELDQQQQSSQGPGHQKHVEHHKLVQRFRQFLAEEDKFWAKLVGRVYRTFALEEARPNLEVIGIPLEDEQTAQQGAGNGGHGRTQQLFPMEESTPRVESKTAAEKEARMSTLGKALVCLGDVARYRELYNEAGGRPKAGHEDGGPARKRNRKGPAWIENMSKARNYDKAQQCYEQAKLLVPHEGKPSHQLAILASYKNDAYLSLAYYYRALCVKQPCDTALNNMRLLLIKNLKESGMEATQDKGKVARLDVDEHPGLRVDKFKKRVVWLHALWRIGSESGIEKMNSIARKLDYAIFRDFATLVGQRQMPPDMITQAIAMSQGALWKHRMLRDSSGEQQQDGSSAMLEWSIVKHIMDMHSALLEVGRDEVKVPPSHDTKDDLGQQLSAVFKRTLPALRVASKWLRANVKYLSQDPEFAAYQRKRRGSVAPKSPNKISGYSHHTKQFWELYAEFSRTLARTFPLPKLRKLASPLEEDADLQGFLPLKKMMSEVPTDEQGKVKPREEVHPNEEQLMRIADLLQDARALAETETSPIQYYSKSGIIMLDIDAFETEMPKVKAEAARPPEMVQPPVSRPPAVHLVQIAQIDSEQNNHEDDLSDISPDADDDEDVVRAAMDKAFKELNEADEDEDDEQIVFDPRPTISPTRIAVSPPASTSPISPPRPIATMIGNSVQSPNRTNGTSPRAVAPTTAEDLLIGVMGYNRSPAPLPPIPFNANTTHRSTQSIWSTSPDEIKMMAGTGPSVGPLFNSPPLQYSSLAAPTQTPELPSLSQQSIWGPPPRPSGGFEAVQQALHGSAPGSGLGLGTPSSFSQHHGSAGLSTTNGANAGRSLLQHKRVSSFAQQMQLQQQSQYQSHPSASPTLANPSHRSGMITDPSLALSMDGMRNPDLTGAIRGPHDLFYNPNFQAGTSYHTRHLSYNDPRLGPGMQQPPPSVWGNT